MLPPDAVAQVAPLETVAKAGPAPSRPLVLLADVVTENVGEPLPVDTSIVPPPPVGRTRMFRASVNVPPPGDVATTSVWPALMFVVLEADSVTGVEELATRDSRPPVRVMVPPNFGAAFDE